MSEIKTAEEILTENRLKMQGDLSALIWRTTAIKSMHDFHNQFKHSVGDDGISKGEFKQMFIDGDIYDILRKHKLPLKKREEVLTDLLQLFNSKLSTPKESDAVEFAEWVVKEEFELEIYGKELYELFLKTKGK